MFSLHSEIDVLSPKKFCHIADAPLILKEILEGDAGLISVRVEQSDWATEPLIDLPITAESQAGVEFRFAVAERRSITPRAAEPLFGRMAELAPEYVPLLFCPVISPRVAELAGRFGISWCDFAGNCRIHKLDPPFLIVRQGRKPIKVDSKLSKLADPFSPKSSRIVRALLSDPGRVWSVQELADHPDVGVSLGLVSKVRQSLARNAYIAASTRGVRVSDPAGLLAAWSRVYSGPVARHLYFAAGEPADIELRFVDWCRQNGLTVTLSGLSAAWKFAPMVRSPVVTAYVDPVDSFSTLNRQLAAQACITPVDSGPNLIVWEAYDLSVFAARHFSDDTRLSWTSPIQTWLDLQQLQGRGQEASDELYQRFIKPDFDQNSADRENDL